MKKAQAIDNAIKKAQAIDKAIGVQEQRLSTLNKDSKKLFNEWLFIVLFTTFIGFIFDAYQMGISEIGYLYVTTWLLPKIFGTGAIAYIALALRNCYRKKQ